MSAVDKDVTPNPLSLPRQPIAERKHRKWLPCDPTDPADQVVRIALQDRLQNVPELLEQVVANGADVPDSVRKLRVATRRAATAVNLFSEFATPATTNQISRDLKKIRKAAGRLRDLDVLIESTQARDPSSAHLPNLDSLRLAAQSKIEKSYRKFVESGRLAENTRQLLTSLEETRDGSDWGAFDVWARPTLAETATAFFQSWPIARGSESEDFIALHNFRLQVKRLRYEVELLGKAMPKKKRKKLHRQLKSLQTALGEVNDHDVSMQSIPRWMRDATEQERSILTAQFNHEHAARTEAVVSFHNTWTTATRDKLKSRFDRILAEPEENVEKADEADGSTAS